MTVDKNGVELKVGDTIRLEGVIGTFYNDDPYTLCSDGRGRTLNHRIVEFVSRPEPTVSVELTFAELLSLRTEYGPMGLHDKIVTARRELRNET